MYALQEQGVPAGVCQRTDDKMVRDEQLAEREFYREAPHAEIGVHKYEGYPVSFSGARWRMDRGAPLLGEDTMAVLTDLLGYTHEEVAQMMSELAVS
jgi:crotonobetainyl-CoA:carnitine CoA-transferase CaiB-like acyl-CoA transferase